MSSDGQQATSEALGPCPASRSNCIQGVPVSAFPKLSEKRAVNYAASPARQTASTSSVRNLCVMRVCSSGVSTPAPNASAPV